MITDRLTMRDTVSLAATVSLLDFARSLNLDWDRMETISARIERLRYVDEVEDRHQFWVRLELETSNEKVARKRIEAALAKIERILRRYAKEG
jgi:hypothetical protein